MCIPKIQVVRYIKIIKIVNCKLNYINNLTNFSFALNVMHEYTKCNQMQNS